jgi:hypothetical protein
MVVEAIMTLENQGWTDTGSTPEDTVTPEAVWHARSELESAK